MPVSLLYGPFFLPNLRPMHQITAQKHPASDQNDNWPAFDGSPSAYKHYQARKNYCPS
jgi:hypothetical protein